MLARTPGRVELTAPAHARVHEAGMAPGVEAAHAREGVGGAGFEQNIIVTPDGAELITNTPMRWWQDVADPPPIPTKMVSGTI